ncbi:MAG: hypothetical protein WCG26_01615, partial [Chloroflexales bacterium]
LNANGRIFLVNPNGILFAPGSRVDAAGLIATTMGISNENFLNGNYTFNRDGASGSVDNQGQITVRNGGYVALLSPEVRNSGSVVADMGTMVISANAASVPATRVAAPAEKALSAAPAVGATPTAPAAPTKSGLNPAVIGGGVLAVAGIAFFAMRGGGAKPEPAVSAPTAAVETATVVSASTSPAPTPTITKGGDSKKPPVGATQNMSKDLKTSTSKAAESKAPASGGSSASAPAPSAQPSAPPAAAPVTTASPEALYDRVYAKSASKDDARAVVGLLSASYMENLKGPSLGTAYTAQALAFSLLGRDSEACTAAKRAQAAGATSKTKNVIETFTGACP